MILFLALSRAARGISTRISTLLLKTARRGGEKCFRPRAEKILRRILTAPTAGDKVGSRMSSATPYSTDGFTMTQLLWSNLAARPLRTLLSVLAIALQVFLILFMVGLTTGIVSEWGKRVEGIGADILVQAPNSSIFFAFSPAVMLQDVGKQIEKLNGVDTVSPVLVMMNTATMDVVYGIDYRTFNGLSKGFLFLQGRRMESNDEALVDDIKAQTKNIKVGDKVTLLGREFTVSGIVAHGKGARFFIPLAAAQEISGAENRVTLFYVRSMGATEATRREIVNALPEHRIRSMNEYLTLMNSSNLPQFDKFFMAFVVVGVVISFLVVLLSMHTMVLERTREIGILKSLGAGKLDVVRLFLKETMLMTGMGIALGVAGTFLVRLIVVHAFPTLTVQIPLEWVWRAMLLAIAGALGGALYPAYRAARCDPVDALAYE
ncbi:MAG TPA: FtsX-like permease family protein [Candidatus Nitrosotenuis sp.]|nr:FtsX-like permease family protein [Candidatus Nitrosotenuis sp.]